MYRMSTKSYNMQYGNGKGKLLIVESAGIILWQNRIRDFKDFTVPFEAVKKLRATEEGYLIIESCGDQFLFPSHKFTPSCSIERDDCLEFLQHAVHAFADANYKEQFEKFFMRKFIDIIGVDIDINTLLTSQIARSFNQEIENFLPETSLDGLFYELPHHPRTQDILTFLREIICEQQLKIFDHEQPGKPSLRSQYVHSFHQNISQKSFEKFLKYEQKVLDRVNKPWSVLLAEYGIHSANNDLTLYRHEFLDYLFSRRNDIFIPDSCDMDQPMSSYYIASSHNTYITGHQMYGRSSEDMYKQVLLRGCRCVELDCWAENGEIVIKHGMAPVTPVLFENVVSTINDYAFETSPYPVVLSIENHCSVELQRKMAHIFRTTFKDKLLTEPVGENETRLPSPNMLKYKILIKFRTLSTNPAEVEPENLNTENLDIVEGNPECMIDTTARGLLFLQNHENRTWTPHLFSLTKTSLFFTDSDEDLQLENSMVESYSYELWFHDTLEGGIEEGLQRLSHIQKTQQQVDFGSFFVAIVKEDLRYSLYLFILCNDCHFFEIKRTIDTSGKTFYSLDGGDHEFAYLQDLITYYRNHPLFLTSSLVMENQEILLSVPIYRKDDHTKMEWFHSTLTKRDTTMVMHTLSKPGSFMVREGTSKDGLSITYCNSAGEIKRVKLTRREDGYFFEKYDLMFNSSVSAVQYFQLQHLWDQEGVAPYPISSKEARELLQKAGRTMTPTQRKRETVFNLERASVSEFPEKHINPLPICDLWAFRLKMPGPNNQILACKSYEDALHWIANIKENTKILDKERLERELECKTAMEMSDIVVYFKKGNFKRAYNIEGGGDYNDVYSLDEKNMTSLILADPKKTRKFHKTRVTRIYPEALRINSANFCPLLFWKHGCQLVALNYQMNDLPMQINEAWFDRTGQCGYVAQPDFDDPSQPMYFEITILGARAFDYDRPKNASISAAIEVFGDDIKEDKHKVCLKGHSFCMVSDSCKPCKLKIKNSDFSLLQFRLLETRNLTTQCLGQNFIHVNNCRQGYRSVMLKDPYSEPILLRSLLVHINIWRKIELDIQKDDLQESLNDRRNAHKYHAIKKDIKKIESVAKILNKLATK